MFYQVLFIKVQSEDKGNDIKIIKIEKSLDKYFLIWYPSQGKTTVDSRCLWLKAIPTEEVTKYVDVFSLSVCMSGSFLNRLHLLLLRVLLKL